jgi:hypothetical protein
MNCHLTDGVRGDSTYDGHVLALETRYLGKHGVQLCPLGVKLVPWGADHLFAPPWE